MLWGELTSESIRAFCVGRSISAELTSAGVSPPQPFAETHPFPSSLSGLFCLLDPFIPTPTVDHPLYTSKSSAAVQLDIATLPSREMVSATLRRSG